MKKFFIATLILSMNMLLKAPLLAMGDEDAFSEKMNKKAMSSESSHRKIWNIPPYLVFENPLSMRKWMEKKLKIFDTPANLPLFLEVLRKQIVLPVEFELCGLKMSTVEMMEFEAWDLRYNSIIDPTKIKSVGDIAFRNLTGPAEDRGSLTANITKGDIFEFIYNYSVLRCMIYIKSAEHETDDTKKAEFYQEVKRTVDYYNAHEFISAFSEPHKIFYDYSLQLNLFAIASVDKLIGIPSYREDASGDVFKNSLRYMVLMYHMQQNILSKHPLAHTTEDLKKQKKENSERLAYYYGTLYELTKEETYYANMLEEHKKLKKEDGEFFNKSREFVEIIKNAREARGAHSSFRLKKQVFNISALKKMAIQYRDQDFLEEIELKSLDLKEKYMQLVNECTTIYKNSKKNADDSFFSEITTTIQKFEHYILNTCDLKSQNERPSNSLPETFVQSKVDEISMKEEELKKTYDIYQTICASAPDRVVQSLVFLIANFMRVGQIEEAYLRFCINEAFLEKTNPELTRSLKAVLKNFMGQPEELYTLLMEIKDSKNTLKRSKEKRRADLIKETLHAKTVQNERVGVSVQSKSKTSGTSILKSDLQTNMTFISEPMSSGTEDKEEKKKRHQDREKQRIEQKQIVLAANIDNEEAVPQVPLNPFEETLEEREDPRTIKDLYELTTASHKVEEEIKENTWNFTKENFMNYLENLGCTAYEGKGAHTRLSLPDSIIYRYKNGELITILTASLNIEGGSLTLPSWDHDTPPHYLRRQILETRKKLRLLALRVKKEVSINL